MARNTFSRFLRGAVNTGAATYPLGKAAIPLAIGGGILEAATGGTPKFDRKPYDKAFNNYVTGVRRDTRSMARELGSQRGARLAARGINESGVGDYLHGQNNTRLYAQSQRHINDARANLESQIGHAENMIQQSADVRERQQWGETRNMLLGKLNEYANPDQSHVEKAQVMNHVIKELRSLGRTDQQIIAYLRKTGFLPEEIQQAIAPQQQQQQESSMPWWAEKEKLGPHQPWNQRNQTEQPNSQTHPNAFTPPQTLPERNLPTNPVAPADPNLGDGVSLPGHAKATKPKSPVVRQALSTLGDLNNTYLEVALGEDYADVFEWNDEEANA